MLRGDLEGDDLEQYVQERVITTTLDRAANWARGNSLFPATFGLACCAIEMMSVVGARLDIARFGFEAFRASPRQADLLILSGRVSIKMAPIVRRIYDQMLDPKYAIAMGACTSSMGVFNNYAIVPADKFLPVDVHVPGCPPRPEALMHGILKLRSMVHSDPAMGWRERYGARAPTRSPTRATLTAQAPSAGTSTSSTCRPGRPPVPDAPGTELLAQELREAHPEAVLGTDSSATRARSSSRPRRSARSWSPARQGLPHL